MAFYKKLNFWEEYTPLPGGQAGVQLHQRPNQAKIVHARTAAESGSRGTESSTRSTPLGYYPKPPANYVNIN